MDRLVSNWKRGLSERFYGEEAKLIEGLVAKGLVNRDAFAPTAPMTKRETFVKAVCWESFRGALHRHGKHMHLTIGQLLLMMDEIELGIDAKQTVAEQEIVHGKD